MRHMGTVGEAWHDLLRSTRPMTDGAARQMSESILGRSVELAPGTAWAEPVIEKSAHADYTQWEFTWRVIDKSEAVV